MDQKIFNAIYGAIIGDALGVPVEFMPREELKKNPVTDMRNGGTYNLPKGSWSDDSSMMLCLADSIGKLGGLDYEDIMKRFSDWLFHHKYTPDGKTFDCGKTCSKAIFRFIRDETEPLDCGGTGEGNNGNGSLMRIAPLPFYLLKKIGPDAMENPEAFEMIHNVSMLTHGHAISLLGCDIYCAIMLEILKGTRNKADILGFSIPKIGAYVRSHPDFSYASSKYERIYHLNFKDLPENQIKSSGYVVDTLEAALWCFLNTDSYRDCVLKAVNLGFDTDTVACVAGSIAGLYYSDIPAEWISAIRNKKLIDKIIGEFCNAEN